MRLVLVLLMLYASIAAADETNFTQRRQQLVDEVRTYARYAGDTPFSDAVMESLNAVERHRFVPAREVASAYENRPLPIGHGQTISQPYIVALMTDLLEPEPGDVVLEVGTGSGYQAAVLSGLVATVYSIEIIEPLAEQAADRLRGLGYNNVVTRLGDGYYGWGEHAPFDGIIVTAAASHVPPPLIEQLKPGGRMVIPVGARFATQYLLLLEKNDDGEVMSRQIAAVRFVPLTGKH
jgi:protein-L-isoaspartate(D-aspartate) O-methyltransferase